MMQLVRSNRLVTVVILAMVVTVVAVDAGLCLCLDGVGQGDFWFVLYSVCRCIVGVIRVDFFLCKDYLGRICALLGVV